MDKEYKIKIPRYRQIAMDVASRVANGELKEGSRIFGRSTLAGEYNVSPETIRRAVVLLEEMEVVKSSMGSGVLIKSVKHAQQFLESYQSKESIDSLRENIRELMEKKRDIENEIMEIIDKIIDYSGRLKNSNPITPVEIQILDDSHLIGRTLSGSEFWQKTGATIIGIRRGQEFILSPGPFMKFEKSDTILAVGDMQIIERAKMFMMDEEFVPET